MNEFDFIAKYFQPLTDIALDDDAAVLRVPPGHELVVTSDTLNAGTHFHEDMSAGDIARKALRVNLSDLAAMGAKPLAYQLNIAFPDAPEEAWMEGFVAALAQDQQEFGVFLSGGDTTGIKGPLSLSITAAGLVLDGGAVKRSGAREGDVILVSGPVGHGAISEYRHMPTPRLDLVEALRSYGGAAADISDGLVADLGHIVKASGLKAIIEVDDIPLADPKAAFEAQITGGDDYELVFTCAPADAVHFEGAQVIGRIEAGQGVHVLKGGAPITLSKTGWQHF